MKMWNAYTAIEQYQITLFMVKISSYDYCMCDRKMRVQGVVGFTVE